LVRDAASRPRAPLGARARRETIERASFRLGARDGERVLARRGVRRVEVGRARRLTAKMGQTNVASERRERAERSTSEASTAGSADG